jgi:hypothetical protein
MRLLEVYYDSQSHAQSGGDPLDAAFTGVRRPRVVECIAMLAADHNPPRSELPDCDPAEALKQIHNTRR